MLTPAFHFQILRGYVDIFAKCTEKLSKLWNQLAHKSEEFDIFPQFTALTLDIIGLCAFNYEIGAIDNQNQLYVQAIYQASQLVFDRTFSIADQYEFVYRYLSTSGRRFHRCLDTIHKLPYQVIQERKEEMKRSQSVQQNLKEKKYLDFLDLLLVANMNEEEPLSDEEIRAEVDTFMFEGHDTTAAALTWTMYLLSKHPEVQAKVQKEIDIVLGDKPYPSYDDLDKFNYLSMVLKESLRLYPSVPFITRRTDVPIQLCGKHVPANTELFVSPYALHRNKQVWGQDADKFNPENFSPEKSHEPFSYIPFSGGNRNCIGQHFALLEEKAVIAILLKKFSLRVVENHPVLPEPHLILRPQHGVKVTVVQRTK